MSDEESNQSNQSNPSNRSNQSEPKEKPKPETSNRLHTFVQPSSKTKLKACEKCRLVKSEEQWRTNSCQNCHWPKDKDSKDYTTVKFQSIVNIIEPNRSWLRRKLMLGKSIVSGIYAVSLL